MPPGHACSKPPARVIEKTTAKTCLAIAQRVLADRQQSGDRAGADAALQVARSIEAELLSLG